MSKTDSPRSQPCCVSDARIARRFDERASQWTDDADLPPLVDVSGALLDLLRDATLERPTVLEMGCGTGALSVALLEMGASRVRGIDLSAGSVDVARRRAAAAGFGAQASFEVGDASAATPEQHDWVVLDRAICCFPDADRLLASAIAAARQRIAISVPESRGWRGLIARPQWAIEGLWDRLHGGFPGHVHDVRRLEAQIAAAGFRLDGNRRIGLWFAAVYRR